MPTYEFKCDTCKVSVELMFSISEYHIPKCELCGNDMKQNYAAPGIVFNAPGFYKTDNK